MPCFKGIAVSIHANGAPLPEYGMQKQSRVSRISSFIPVPQPQLNSESGKAEPAKFAISITLLTPGLPIPYSTPKATDANPYPKPQMAADMAAAVTGDRAKLNGAVSPYIPMTNSENETVAAYIYFDGRAKEEVATLLRPGEETWVNSRWVQIPDSEGGGLAEREFLFREVGLERWLNGLDLEGHDIAAKLEKRRQKFEKRRRRQEAQKNGGVDPGSEHSKHGGRADTLRYGGADSPVEAVSDDESDTFSSDDEIPEAAGQIKVAMFRVLASGEIKKGEYSPQFDAHDDDDEYEGGDNKNGNAGSGSAVEPDVEHTTSFAKPKSLDPKTISTQTVTGIDGPDKPYATFTFFYRGDRQLQKLGLVPSAKSQQATPGAAKRRSAQLDFSNLGPLKTSGTVGFSAFRDHDVDSTRRRKSRKKSNGSLGAGGAAMDEDSDEDDSSDEPVLAKMEDTDDKDVKTTKLEPEDVKFSSELADSVGRIHLKRQHSAEPDSAGASITSRKSPSAGPFGGSTTPPDTSALGGNPAANLPGLTGSLSGSLFGKNLPDDSVVGSPLKKHRASIAEGASANDEQGPRPTSAFPPALGDVLAKAEAAQGSQQQVQPQQQELPKIARIPEGEDDDVEL